MHLGRNLVVSILFTVVTTIIFGIAYPLAITLVAQAVFPGQANGQLVERDGVVVGSRLIAQKFESPVYFHARPSAAGDGYDAGNSAGSQLGPTNRKLIDAVRARVEAERLHSARVPVPVDLVTTSASGFDPHVSPAAAMFQVARVARARRVEEKELATLVGEHVEGRQFGFLGEPRVNVLELNLALDRRYPQSGAQR